MRVSLATSCLACAALAVAGCRDLSSFSTNGDSFVGPVVAASFVQAGVGADGGLLGAGVSLCLTLDTNHLQDAPGTLSTSDGRFQTVPLRPIPQIWQDPLSTLTFGEGRLKNLVYVAGATTPFGDGNGNDAMAVVSLMQAGDIEVRLIRGAPGAAVDGGTPGAPASNLFAVFDLVRQSGPCSF
jgi:hypothetical protein